MKKNFLISVFIWINFSSLTYSSFFISDEDLLYTTIQIKCQYSNNKQGTGTGFIYEFIDPNTQKKAPYLVASKNLLNSNILGKAIQGSFIFNLAAGTNNSNRPLELRPANPCIIGDQQENFYNFFYQHPSVDLCAMSLGPIIKEINYQLSKMQHPLFINSVRVPQNISTNSFQNISTNSFQNTSTNSFQNTSLKVFYRALDVQHLVDFQNELAIQEILVVGHPIKFTDTENNLPIIYGGMTSSNLRSNYKNKPEILIEASCFPGSAGSPVFLKNPTFHKGRFLGILWGQALFETNEEIGNNDRQDMICIPIQTYITNFSISARLGFIIKSTELNEIQRMINSYYIQQKINMASESIIL